MAKYLAPASANLRLTFCSNGRILHNLARHSSSATAASHGALSGPASSAVQIGRAATPSAALSRLSTGVILRNLLLGSFFTRPILFKAGLAFMKLVADSRSRFLNPDKNPFLRHTIKPLVYDQFCAGTNDAEIRKTSEGIRQLGFSGVVLCYGKEMYAEDAGRQHDRATDLAHLEQWKQGNLHTLSLTGKEDWLGIKFTGAGPGALSALVNNGTPPPEFQEAMHAICQDAQSRGARIWIDAEQSAVQKAIDNWTIDLMRTWNRGPKPVVYNTIQAYLKSSRSKLQHQLKLAKNEGWTLGIKLVRGAYISVDDRGIIFDTKPETDRNYESIVKDLLSGTLPGFSRENFPKMRLMCAGHNSSTIEGVLKLASDLDSRGELKVRPEFAQLQGMADDVGCKIVQVGEDIARDKTKDAFTPKVYKCLTWGSLQECMQYLVRRAVENQGAAARIGESRAGFSAELRRRVWGGA